jgi:hypothetical protein
VKQKKISEIGTQQLLLDTYNIKTLLLHFHHMGQANPSAPSSSSSSTGPLSPPLFLSSLLPDSLPPHLLSCLCSVGDVGSLSSVSGVSSSSIPPMYMKLITSKITHIEIVLKLIGTPEEFLVDRFRIMWPEGSANDLQMIMSLSGVSRVHQQQYLESFGVSHASPGGGGGGGAGAGAGSSINGGISAATTGAGAGGGGASGVPRLPTIPSLPSSATASANATVNSMANSVRSLTLDLSSTARSAVGDLRKGFTLRG